MKKEIQLVYQSLKNRIAIYINNENFLLTQAIFELILIDIVDEVENFSLNNVQLNSNEKRNLGIALIEVLLRDLFKKDKIDTKTFEKFSSPNSDIFREAKIRWRNRTEEKNSCNIF